MKPLASLDAKDASGLRGLLFDLDDTLLTHGVLTREAYGALWDLRDAGLRLVAVTGRPSGWGEIVVRQWPIDAAVTENGAVVVVREGRGVARVESCTADERASRRAKLANIVSLVRAAVPEANLADDVSARTSDVTWDIGERAKLPEDRVRAIARIIEAEGARWTASSVHLHATYDAEDKASGTVGYLARHFGEDPGAARARYAFAGDSGNDAACFNAFDVTFGVANVCAHLGRLVVTPRYVAPSEMGAGFAEIARAILRNSTRRAAQSV